MAVTAGLSGFLRNASVAIAANGRLASVVEEGRVTRVRDVGVRANGFPHAAMGVALEAARLKRSDVNELVIAEPELEATASGSREIDHHFAHAATAFFTSPHQHAAVVVCDSAPRRSVSVWIGSGTELKSSGITWDGPGFAELYSGLTAALGFQPGRDEYQVEALARYGTASAQPAPQGLRYRGYGIEAAGTPFDDAAAAGRSGDVGQLAAAADAVQRLLGELLAQFLGDVRAVSRARHLCLGGGLFFNTYLNTRAKEAGLFDDTFVPVNPGNGGVSAGCALARVFELAGSAGQRPSVSPFLGPEYTNQDIKAVLDNCKLSYDFLEDSQIVHASVQALQRGELVGWFRGRLEWGPRALGNRSIFANPRAPFVLENLNRYLKHRDAHRAYGLMVPLEQRETYFEGPASSEYMECEYTLRDPAAFGSIAPPGLTRVRVQTVGDNPPLIRQLLDAFGQATGVPVLVNTSFNGLHEPIVCSPRDAVRVFYGTGIDVLVVGNFLIRK